MIKSNINLLYITLVFPFATFVHELGHWTTCRLLGYPARLKYNMVSHNIGEKIDKSLSFIEQIEFISTVVRKDYFIITLFGPIFSALLSIFALRLWHIYKDNSYLRPIFYSLTLTYGTYIILLRFIFIEVDYLKNINNDFYKICDFLQLPYEKVILIIGLSALLWSIYVIQTYFRQAKVGEFIKVNFLLFLSLVFHYCIVFIVG